MARPTKYTPETVERIINGVRLGMPFKHAAMLGGIDEDTMIRWRKRYADFADAIKAAESEAIAGRLGRIRKAEDDSWQAAAWWLERRYPHDFGKTVNETQHTGKDGGPLVIQIGERKDGPQ